ncbi:hypothetical protein C2W64_04723 [Brevibacillus laterosporus]|nr:hypothetical protein C2W64_04723 [Brevibacillus laterosporus]
MSKKRVARFIQKKGNFQNINIKRETHEYIPCVICWINLLGS